MGSEPPESVCLVLASGDAGCEAAVVLAAVDDEVCGRSLGSGGSRCPAAVTEFAVESVLPWCPLPGCGPLSGVAEATAPVPPPVFPAAIELPFVVGSGGLTAASIRGPPFVATAACGAVTLLGAQETGVVDATCVVPDCASIVRLTDWPDANEVVDTDGTNGRLAKLLMVTFVVLLTTTLPFARMMLMLVMLTLVTLMRRTKSMLTKNDGTNTSKGASGNHPTLGPKPTQPTSAGA